MKRAQMTLTIILAVTIIAVFTFVFYITGSSVENRIERAQQKQQAGQEAIEPLTDYVSQCLDQVGLKGLQLIGLQGGLIYQSQGGPTVDPIAGEFVEYQGNQVSYGIEAPEGRLLPGLFVVGDFEQYPWRTFPHSPSGDEYFKGYYGLNTLPPLHGENSIDHNLMTYVENGMLECVDWQVFASRSIEVSTGEPRAEILFADMDTKITLHYPINITNTVAGVEATLESFSASYPVRLRRVVNFSHAVADNDVSDISFELSGVSAIENPEILAITNAVSVDNDIITIRDPLSRFPAEEFVFQFARENRQPALFFIDITEDTCPGTNVTSTGDGFRIESCLGVSTEQLRILDPDEDNVTIAFRAADRTALPLTIEQERDSFVNVTITDPAGLQDAQFVDLPFDPLGGSP